MKRRRAGERARDQAQALGRDVRLARVAAGLSTGGAARRAGVSRSTLERVEMGSAAATLATLCSLSDAVGLDLVIRAYPGRGTSLRDRGQLLIAEHLARTAHRAWKVRLEVTAGEHGQAIDEVFWGPDEILAIEIVRHIGDYQGQYRSVSLEAAIGSRGSIDDQSASCWRLRIFARTGVRWPLTSAWSGPFCLPAHARSCRRSALVDRSVLTACYGSVATTVADP